MNNLLTEVKVNWTRRSRYRH